MSLDHISVKGFRSIRSIDRLALAPINVLIGPNGSGKSNFVEFFSFMREVRDGKLQEYVRQAGGADSILHYGSKQTPLVEVALSFNGEVNSYRLTLQASNDDSLFPLSEEALFWDKSYKRPYSEGLLAHAAGREAGISDPRVTRTAGRVRALLASWRVYHVHDTSKSSPMRKTSQVDDSHFLRPDGSNLAAFLFRLSQTHEEHYSLIRRTVHRVAPFFDDFALQPDAVNPRFIRLAWTHKESDQYFAASALSDGTLRFIVLATLLLQPENLRPSVILVDEPELGLHPYAITLLASLVKQASVSTQVVLSTQSPLLLDHFRPEDVLVAERVEGATQLRRLESSRLDEWLVDYSLGQLWEKNELGGRPSKE
jgi:predicted ATPase